MNSDDTKKYFDLRTDLDSLLSNLKMDPSSSDLKFLFDLQLPSNEGNENRLLNSIVSGLRSLEDTDKKMSEQKPIPPSLPAPSSVQKPILPSLPTPITEKQRIEQKPILPLPAPFSVQRKPILSSLFDLTKSSPHLIGTIIAGLLLVSSYLSGELLKSTFIIVCFFFCGAGAWFCNLIMNNSEMRESVVGTVTNTGLSFLVQSPALRELVQIVTNIFSGNKQEKVNVSVAKLIHEDKVMSIEFQHNSESYRLLVPYNRSAARSGNVRVSISSDGTRTNLNHHPGLPLLVTSDMLQCADILTEEEEI